MKTPLLKSAVTLLSLTATLASASYASNGHDKFRPKQSNEATKNQADAAQEGDGVEPKVNPALKVEETTGKAETENEPKRGANQTRAEKAAQFRAAEEEKRAIFAARMREVLTKAGFAETVTQDAIIAYIASEEEAKGALRNATRRLAFSLRREAPPERVRDLLAEYKKATDAERLRKEKSRMALDEKIGYSKNPRLEAILLISGILGDGSGFRFDMVMQRSVQGGPQNRQYPGARERTERERTGTQKPEVTPEPHTPEAMPDVVPKREKN